MAAPTETCETRDLFKEHFKLYKRRHPAPDLSQVVDFSEQGSCPTKSSKVIPVNVDSAADTKFECGDSKSFLCGLKPTSDWKVYKHSEVPGLIFVENPFLPGYERYWVAQCLSTYPEKPNVTNLDALAQAHHDIWRTSVRERNDRSHDSFQKTSIQKLRWATLGYHHNWDTKKYSSDRHTEFPVDLSLLCGTISRVLGFSDFQAEAAIVNFYHQTSTLSGHTDHSEPNNEAPLISISFGCPAVFLVGGQTKAVKPVAMYIRNGDVVIMSGPARLAYHGVPKILVDYEPSVEPGLACVTAQNTNNDCTCDRCKKLYSVNNNILECLRNLSWNDYDVYLRTSRINMNVRQVLLPGQKELEDHAWGSTPPHKVPKVTDT